MQIDAEFAAVIGIASSLLTAGIGYGIMSEKVRRVEEDLHELKDGQKDYVTFHHFDAVIEPIKRTLELVQKDVKEILRAVSTSPRAKN
jgi:hypothetical protein